MRINKIYFSVLVFYGANSCHHRLNFWVIGREQRPHFEHLFVPTSWKFQNRKIWRQNKVMVMWRGGGHVTPLQEQQGHLISKDNWRLIHSFLHRFGSAPSTPIIVNHSVIVTLQNFTPMSSTPFTPLINNNTGSKQEPIRRSGLSVTLVLRVINYLI